MKNLRWKKYIDMHFIVLKYKILKSALLWSSSKIAESLLLGDTTDRAEPPDVEVFYDILNTAAQKLTVVAMPTERNRNVNWTWDIRYKLNTRRFVL